MHIIAIGDIYLNRLHPIYKLARQKPRCIQSIGCQNYKTIASAPLYKIGHYMNMVSILRYEFASNVVINQSERKTFNSTNIYFVNIYNEPTTALHGRNTIVKTENSFGYHSTRQSVIWSSLILRKNITSLREVKYLWVYSTENNFTRHFTEATLLCCKDSHLSDIPMKV